MGGNTHCPKGPLVGESIRVYHCTEMNRPINNSIFPSSPAPFLRVMLFAWGINNVEDKGTDGC